MCFGLKTAPVIFQRAMNEFLSPVKLQSPLGYPDNMAAILKKINNHWVHFQEALTLLRNAGVILKVTECSFLPRRMFISVPVQNRSTQTICADHYDCLRSKRS